MTVYPPLKLLPETVNIAWEPTGNVTSGYTLGVSGGSGDYFWTVLDPKATSGSQESVVTVSNEGILKPTVSRQLSKFTREMRLRPN